MTRLVGVVVNPVAGVGGPAGLKGSDGTAAATALAAGVRPASASRAARALQVLVDAGADVDLLTCAGPMGVPLPLPGSSSGLPGSSAGPVEAGRTPGRPTVRVVHTPPPITTGADTTAAVGALAAAGAELILFVGGDGTARDVAAGLPAGVEVLGVPAGVKMYSSVFAVGPEAAGALLVRWARGGLPTRTAEVLDVDEQALRSGDVQPRLHSLVPVPEWAGRTQARKAATPASEAAAVRGAAAGVRSRLEPSVTYLMGPGGTLAEVGRQLGLDFSPLGVDVVRDGVLLARDVAEAEAHGYAAAGVTRAVLTVIGGQGFVLGRGNQQLSPRVLRSLAPDPLLVVATEGKLLDLDGRPLLVDTGDPELDAELTGHVPVVTGPRSVAMYPLALPQ